MSLPRRRLGTLPTPLTEARALSAAIRGPRLWLKRDDLIGFGFGGNKVRSLEYLVGQALAEGADTLVTGAGAQSNHVRATAAAASFLGLAMVAVYWGREPERVEGNLRLTRMLGAQTRFTDDVDRAALDGHIQRVAGELRQAGRRPYAIPRGGGCGRGVLAHVEAVRELAGQMDGIDAVVLAVGSGTTLAGWLLGSRLAPAPWRIEAYTVSRPAAELRAQVSALAREGAELLGVDVLIEPGDVQVHDGFIGDGYGIPSASGNAAIRLAARTQGVFFDPTYTGKAFAGFMEHVGEGRFDRDETVVFLHTGGEPALFAGEAVT